MPIFPCVHLPSCNVGQTHSGNDVEAVLQQNITVTYDSRIVVSMPNLQECARCGLRLTPFYAYSPMGIDITTRHRTCVHMCLVNTLARQLALAARPTACAS